MKARVKATGRIIEVMCVMNIEGVAVWEDISGISTTPNQYTSDELEFLDFPEMPIVNYTPDYWTRLEHQYAGMAMQGMLNNSYLAGEFRRDPNNGIEDMSKIITKAAAVYAHALVEKMKEEKK